jgi:hypothetical protein
MKTISISKWVAAVAMTVLSSFTAFAQVTNLNLGNLAPGESVTVTFDVTINNTLPPGLQGITNQAAVSATALATVNSDDPDTLALGDPTVTLLELPPPSLAIRRTPTNTVVVSWPSPSTGFGLQQNGTLAAGSWAAAAEPVTDNGTNKFIIVNPPTANRFYRLFQP